MKRTANTDTPPRPYQYRPYVTFDLVGVTKLAGQLPVVLDSNVGQVELQSLGKNGFGTTGSMPITVIVHDVMARCSQTMRASANRIDVRTATNVRSSLKPILEPDDLRVAAQSNVRLAPHSNGADRLFGLIELARLMAHHTDMFCGLWIQPGPFGDLCNSNEADDSKICQL